MEYLGHGTGGIATAAKHGLASNMNNLSMQIEARPCAADGEYSFTDPANAGMRRKFDLPLDRPLNP
jgi:hypothetical protein